MSDHKATRHFTSAFAVQRSDAIKRYPIRVAGQELLKYRPQGGAESWRLNLRLSELSESIRRLYERQAAIGSNG